MDLTESPATKDCRSRRRNPFKRCYTAFNTRKEAFYLDGVNLTRARVSIRLENYPIPINVAVLIGFRLQLFDPHANTMRNWRFTRRVEDTTKSSGWTVQNGY